MQRLLTRRSVRVQHRHGPSLPTLSLSHGSAREPSADDIMYNSQLTAHNYVPHRQCQCSRLLPSFISPCRLNHTSIRFRSDIGYPAPQEISSYIFIKISYRPFPQLLLPTDAPFLQLILLLLPSLQQRLLPPSATLTASPTPFPHWARPIIE